MSKKRRGGREGIREEERRKGRREGKGRKKLPLPHFIQTSIESGRFSPDVPAVPS